MVTVPVTEGHQDGQDVLFLDQTKAASIFQELRTFVKATAPKTVPKIATSQIAVQVLNGSGVKGIASSTKTALLANGFTDGGVVGDADRSDYAATQIRYVPGALAKAEVVASYLGGVGQLVALPAASGTAAVVVVVGRDFVAVTKPGSHSTVATTTSSTLPANPGTLAPGVTAPASTDGRPPVGCG
jgi:hypothetical protein